MWGAVLPWLGKAATVGGTVGGLAVGVPFVMNERQRQINDIVESGFINPGQKKIEQNWYQQLPIIGTGLTNDQLTDMVHDEMVDDAFERPRYSNQLNLIQSQLGLTWDPEKGSVQSFINQNIDNAKAEQLRQNTENQISTTEAINAYTRSTPEYLAEQGKQSRAETRLQNQIDEQNRRWALQWQQSENARRENFELRQDQLRRQNSLDNRALDNDILKLGLLKQQQANEMTKHGRELDVFRQTKREDMMMALATGLSALGAAFVV